MPSSRALVLLLAAGLLALTVLLNLAVESEQQFSHLARAFLSGQLHFLEMPGTWADTVPSGDRNFWPLGPLPAVLLMPFVFVADLLGVFFFQGYLQPVLVLAVFLLAFRIAERIGYHREDALVAAFGFTFATAFLGVALWPWAWYFAQVISVCLLLLAIHEFTGRCRWWLLGIIFGLLLMTRVTAALGAVWVGLHLLLSREEGRWKSLAKVLVPCVVAVVLLLLYNGARFDSPLEQGYTRQLVPEHAARARDLGVFSPRHVPGNLYHLLLATPDAVKRDETPRALEFPWVRANPWGMSLFITSPCFFWLFGLGFRDRTSRLLLITVATIAVPILLYYGVGYRQFGYRYSLDFLPLLYFLLIRNHHAKHGALTPGLRWVLVGSALTNLYLFAAYFLMRMG
jgi:hypothetical protein